MVVGIASPSPRLDGCSSCAFSSSQSTASTHPLSAVQPVFGAGFCVSGGQVGANALCAAFYPTSYRATGVSWANL